MKTAKREKNFLILALRLVKFFERVIEFWFDRKTNLFIIKKKVYFIKQEYVLQFYSINKTHISQLESRISELIG